VLPSPVLPSTDPDSWTTTLDASLHPTLLGLYALPPHRRSDAPPSDFQRLATTIKLYRDYPTAPAPAIAPQPAPPPSAQDGSTLINITRPLDSTTPGSTPSTGGAPASPSPGQAQLPPTPPTQKKRPRMLMHVDLAAQLPPEVYLALDSAAGMDPEKRAKFHKTCQDSAVTALLDNTTSATFGHQTLLALTEGQHFDPFKRGRVEMVPLNCPLPLFIEPPGAVDKATPPWWRLILDARISNEFQDAWGVWYFSVSQLAALLDVCDIMFAEDLPVEDAYHLSIFSGCTSRPFWSRVFTIDEHGRVVSRWRLVMGCDVYSFPRSLRQGHEWLLH
jgi:hypothetical protein